MKRENSNLHIVQFLNAVVCTRTNMASHHQNIKLNYPRSTYLIIKEKGNYRCQCLITWDHESPSAHKARPIEEQGSWACHLVSNVYIFSSSLYTPSTYIIISTLLKKKKKQNMTRCCLSLRKKIYITLIY